MILSSTNKVSTRFTYGFLEFLRDVGGVSACLIILFKLTCPIFGNIVVYSVLTSKAYFDPVKADGQKSDSDSEKEREKQNKSFAEYGTSKWLWMYFLKCEWIPCRTSKTRDNLDTVEADVTKTLDILALMRRLRVHGEMLTMLTEKNEREQLCKELDMRNLELTKKGIESRNKEISWEGLEGLGQEEAEELAKVRLGKGSKANEELREANKKRRMSSAKKTEYERTYQTNQTEQNDVDEKVVVAPSIINIAPENQDKANGDT